MRAYQGGHGSLSSQRPFVSLKIQTNLPRSRRASAAFSLAVAETAAERHDVVSCAGLLAKAAVEAAQATLAEKGEWALTVERDGAGAEVLPPPPGERVIRRMIRNRLRGAEVEIPVQLRRETLLTVAMGISFLPTYLSTIVGLMALILLLLSYVFGRVALQMIVGKMVQKQLLPDKMQSETVALLIGVLVW